MSLNKQSLLLIIIINNERSGFSLCKKFVFKSGFLLRFEVGGTNIAITGTKEGGGATILARSAKLGYM